ncbi:MAG: hypothetical protein NXI22_06890 [bacterium]|nr:hypothetical protein [bacterium]
MLNRAEYVEQAHFFKMLGQRLPENQPLQQLLGQLREEALASTQLPLAIDFLLGELKHTGVISPAMKRIGHYFSPFQVYVIEEAENERGRFDMRVAVEVLEKEALYRVESPTEAGVFLYQFETIARNRMRYAPGLAAIANDPIFNADWKEWILEVRRRIGMVDFPDMVYIRSEHYAMQQQRRHKAAPSPAHVMLFGEQEGRIALASRKKDPAHFFAAMQRHLNYPEVPRPKPVDDSKFLIPLMVRRIEKLETRLKILEEETKKGAFDLEKYYKRPDDA